MTFRTLGERPTRPLIYVETDGEQGHILCSSLYTRPAHCKDQQFPLRTVCYAHLSQKKKAVYISEFVLESK